MRQNGKIKEPLSGRCLRVLSFRGMRQTSSRLDRGFFIGGEMQYKRYLFTDHWKRVRAQALVKQKVCVLCRSPDSLHVHHNTYERIWHEEPDDLVVLCATCHEKYHVPDDVPDSDSEFWPVVEMSDGVLRKGPAGAVYVQR
jgi:hypothetical protein